MSRDRASAEERFRCLYAEHVDPILGFAMRRADQADDAADIVAETFLVAWRRIDEVHRQTKHVNCLPNTSPKKPASPSSVNATHARTPMRSRPSPTVTPPAQD